jgi:hypothetical protein
MYANTVRWMNSPQYKTWVTNLSHVCSKWDAKLDCLVRTCTTRTTIQSYEKGIHYTKQQEIVILRWCGVGLADWIVFIFVFINKLDAVLLQFVIYVLLKMYRL